MQVNTDSKGEKGTVFFLSKLNDLHPNLNPPAKVVQELKVNLRIIYLFIYFIFKNVFSSFALCSLRLPQD